MERKGWPEVRQKQEERKKHHRGRRTRNVKIHAYAESEHRAMGGKGGEGDMKREVKSKRVIGIKKERSRQAMHSSRYFLRQMLNQNELASTQINQHRIWYRG